MFKKLVSNLPFNPSLISHLRDYDLRLKQDFKLRLTGVLLLTLVLIIQIVVILLPPRSTNSYSPNNLVGNGNGSINQLFSDCVNNSNGYQTILSFYNINCNQLYYGKSASLPLNSSSNNLFSLNRLSYKPQVETTLTISSQNFYIRPLLFGNKLQTNHLDAWLLNLNSQTYYIALDSGNIISTKQLLVQGQSQQTCTQSQSYSCFNYSLTVRPLNSSSINANNTTVPSGTSLIYTLSATNSSAYKITNSTLNINLQNALAYSNIVNTYGGTNQNGVVSYWLESILPNQTQTEIVTTKVKSPIPGNSTSSSDPNYLAQKMIVSFGNSVIVFVPKTINKFYEISINNYLPSASSKVSLIVLVVILLVTVYFLLRTLVIREEIKIIRHSPSSLEEKIKK